LVAIIHTIITNKIITIFIIQEIKPQRIKQKTQMVRGLTIINYLTTGNPEGVIFAYMSNWTGQAINKSELYE
jgi:hypothetical protein